LGSAKPSLHGIDIDPAALVQGAVHACQAHLSRADALSLPFPNEAFDITYCHFLLMWLKQPLRALREIKRVTRKGGSVLAIAEPDYGGRLDGPKALVTLGRLQTKALQQQGADVTLGSRLADLMDRAGIHIQETGAINAWPGRTPSPSDLDSEWEILQSDLAHLVSRAELDRLKAIDAHARALGARLLHVPTYFAWGQV
jgi:SAM-dependent methyltransferase